MKEYLEIPLSTEKIIINLTDKQAGMLFQAAFSYAFDNIKPDFSNDLILEKAFTDFIRQCSKTKANGLMCCTTTFEDYK